ncbi:MAG: hypothetical protein M3083_00125 [Actinomycetota bacterium]|nr:hypothetical protein [Actinomycetota bacterium]
MTAERVHVGQVLRLERRPMQIDPTQEYVSIGIRSFGKGVFHYEPTMGGRLSKLRFFEVEPDRLVVSNIKAWEGAIAVSGGDDAGCIASNRFLTYVPADNRIEVRWARWFFLSEGGNELLQHASPGSADRNRTLAIDRFEGLQITLPPIDEQRRVAVRLDHVEHSATLTGAGLNRQGAGALLRRLPLLVGGVAAGAATGRTQISHLVGFVSDMVHPGVDPEPAKCFIGLQHIESHTGRCVGSDELGALDGRKFRFRPGDIVYGYLRPYLNKVWLADRHGLCSVDQYVLRPRPGVSGSLLAYLLRSEDVLRQTAELTHNLQLPRLRSGLLASIEVPAVSDGHVLDALARLDHVQDLVTCAAELRAHQELLASSLVPASLNEAFAGVR